jgi:hypothetical protein
MEMRFFWITDQVISEEFDVQWQPGQEKLADYYCAFYLKKIFMSQMLLFALLITWDGRYV